MAKDRCDCKSHPSEVAVGVAHEDARGERVVFHQGERSHQEWYDYGHRKLMLVVNQRAFLIKLHFLYTRMGLE